MIQTFVSKFKHITKSQAPGVRNVTNVYSDIENAQINKTLRGQIAV